MKLLDSVNMFGWYNIILGSQKLQIVIGSMIVVKEIFS